jgi:hypothetical protein
MWIKNGITYRPSLVSGRRRHWMHTIGKQRSFELFFEEGFCNVFAATFSSVSGWWWSRSDEMLVCPEEVVTVPSFDKKSETLMVICG